jgi:spore coat polysaccharide biosynthesis protein SpsF (cytidylyltransferase family)
MSKKTDYEYLLVNTTGLEEVIFSSNSLKKIAKFCGMNYKTLTCAITRDSCFKFENKWVKVEKIDINADYGE